MASLLLQKNYCYDTLRLQRSFLFIERLLNQPLGSVGASYKIGQLFLIKKEVNFLKSEFSSSGAAVFIKCFSTNR
jgi:hypothetical protein